MHLPDSQDAGTKHPNFASDPQPEKNTARTPGLMNQEINAKYMSQIHDPDAAPDQKTVACGTCHEDTYANHLQASKGRRRALRHAREAIAEVNSGGRRHVSATAPHCMDRELLGARPVVFQSGIESHRRKRLPTFSARPAASMLQAFPGNEGMRCRFSLSTVCFAASLFAAGSQGASAQPRLDVFVTPFPNAPFSGVIQVQRTFVDQNGAVRSLKTMRNIGRDTQGRIFNEVRTLEPLSFTGTPDVRGILIYDPQTRTSTHLDPKAHTFTTGTVNRPPATVPPALLYASPTGTNLPQNPYLKEEDLGVHEIDGVSAHGVRETQIIPADASSGREIQVTDEYWYSPTSVSTSSSATTIRAPEVSP